MNGRVLIPVDNQFGSTSWGVAAAPDSRIIVGIRLAVRLEGMERYALAAMALHPDGTRDLSFGGGGVAVAKFSVSDDDFGTCLTVQDDGAVLIAGTVEGEPASDMGLARFHADGKPDLSFGINGKTTAGFNKTTSFNWEVSYCHGMALQRDGKILLTGRKADQRYGRLEVALVRFEKNGNLDTGFGTGGRVTTGFGDQEGFGTRVTTQSDGKIVVAGGFGLTPQMLLIRYAADGTIDESFGTGGRVTMKTDEVNVAAAGLAVLESDKILLAFDTGFTVTRHVSDSYLTTKQNWRKSFFGFTGNAGDAADADDPDRDGMVNLLEWVTGSDPLKHTVLPLSAIPGGEGLELIYTRNISAHGAGAALKVEWADNLRSRGWSMSRVTETVISDDGVLQRVKATLPAGDSGRRFARLRVTVPQ